MTATWVVNESTIKRLNFPSLQLPDKPLSFDLVSARYEMYAQPGALPTVKRSSIDDDLRRRDFTINAIAIRLDGEHFGKLFDPLNGQADLENKSIRVLHPKSFVDDPTRIFRAVRYAVRYGFEIAPETLSLVNDEARTVLLQLSGERLRHEFDLIFEEENARTMLKTLNKLDMLKVIHPVLQAVNVEWLRVLTDTPEAEFGEFSIPDILSFRQTLGWILYLTNVPVADIEAIAKRLAFPVLLTKAIVGASTINISMRSFKDWKPSQWTFYLDEVPALAVYALYLMRMDLGFHDYFMIWRSTKPFTTGYSLKQRGLEPGPQFKTILTRLRAAWLDGEVTTEEEEKVLLADLLKS
jgi:tRNA nucleotidyltransferase (CCA-adding enzyme)